MNPASLLKRFIAELVGTYVLVFLGTGSVVTTVLLFKGWTPLPDNAFNIGISMPAWFAIGIAFGIAVIAMIYAFGHISGRNTLYMLLVLLSGRSLQLLFTTISPSQRT